MKLVCRAAVAAAVAALIVTMAPSFAQGPGLGPDRPFTGVGPRARAFHWQGSVDDTVDIYIQGSHVWTQVRSGKRLNAQAYDIPRPLPASPVDVDLTSVDGRGTVRIFQQPNADNGYTVGVRIHDPMGGRGFYSFTLDWR